MGEHKIDNRDAQIHSPNARLESKIGMQNWNCFHSQCQRWLSCHISRAPALQVFSHRPAVRACTRSAWDPTSDVQSAIRTMAEDDEFAHPFGKALAGYEPSLNHHLHGAIEKQALTPHHRNVRNKQKTAHFVRSKLHIARDAQ